MFFPNYYHILKKDESLKRDIPAISMNTHINIYA